MKRRKYLATLGWTAAGLAGLVGTGAFTSVSAERSVNVAVAGDKKAFLGLEPTDGPNGVFASSQGGTLTLDFSKTTNADGSGLGTDSVYEFDDVFQITNQGSQPIYIWTTFSDQDTPFSLTGEDPDVYFYPNGDSGDTLRDSGDEVLYLDVGQSATVGLHVDTTGVGTGQTIELTATINANASKPGESGVVGSDGTTILGPTDGLLGYWPLDGNVRDVVGSNDGTVNGDISFETGTIGQAATFEDTSDAVELGERNTFGLEQFTVSAWAMVDSSPHSDLRTIIARQDPTNQDPWKTRTFVLWFDEGSGHFTAGSITGRTAQANEDHKTVTTDEGYIDGEWHHVVATAATNGELTLYVDGESKGSQSVDGPLYTGPGQTMVGLSPGQSRLLDGAVDDVRIYGRVLSETEVSALYEATK